MAWKHLALILAILLVFEAVVVLAQDFPEEAHEHAHRLTKRGTKKRSYAEEVRARSSFVFFRIPHFFSHRTISPFML